MSTLRAETFVGINFHVFRVFWSFSPKFLPLEILNLQNAKVFPRKIMDIFLKRETRKFFQNHKIGEKRSNFQK